MSIIWHWHRYNNRSAVWVSRVSLCWVFERSGSGSVWLWFRLRLRLATRRSSLALGHGDIPRVSCFYPLALQHPPLTASFPTSLSSLLGHSLVSLSPHQQSKASASSRALLEAQPTSPRASLPCRLWHRYPLYPLYSPPRRRHAHSLPPLPHPLLRPNTNPPPTVPGQPPACPLLRP